MPHCIIEYSQELTQDVAIKALMQAVYNGSVQSSLFASADIKVRAMPYHDFYTENISKANKNQQRFIHVCCKILSGRTLKQRQSLAQNILNQLTQLSLKWVSISIEIVDMEKESYNKQVSE